MREESMVSDTYPETSGDPPQDHRDQECLPTEKEQSDDCPYVKRHHDEGGEPNDGLRESLIPR
jgi:hypothetical protein